MPSSPKENSEEKRAELTARIAEMESEVENLKHRLNDQTQIDALVKRVANCEALAGIIPPQ